jgi:hypothetical protein
MIASAINERLQRKLDYALEEVRVLKEILRAATGKDRLSFTPAQRRRLALAGIELTPKERRECCQIIKPGTILTWFRGLAARKYDSSQRKTGRPRKARDIRRLVVKMALENLNWGYTKIRDPLFTEAFLGILGARGVESVKIPAQSPNCNPHAERFVKTIKYECLNHFIIFGERHLRRLIKEFVEHYMTERFHQGLGGQLIRKQVGPTNDNGAAGKVVRRSRLGGMLNYYHREAA